MTRDNAVAESVREQLRPLPIAEEPGSSGGRCREDSERVSGCPAEVSITAHVFEIWRNARGHFLLIGLILVVAAAGGSLGGLLELAGWIVVGLALLGAVAGFLL